MGRSKIVLTCSSRWRYPLAHYPQAAMAGACLVADPPDTPPDGHESLFVPTGPQPSSKALRDLVGDLLGNPETARQRAAGGLWRRDPRRPQV